MLHITIIYTYRKIKNHHTDQLLFMTEETHEIEPYPISSVIPLRVTISPQVTTILTFITFSFASFQLHMQGIV